MTPAETLTLAAYFFVVIVLAIYGWHRYYLVYLYMSNRDKEPKPGPALDQVMFHDPILATLRRPTLIRVNRRGKGAAGPGRRPGCT